MLYWPHISSININDVINFLIIEHRVIRCIWAETQVKAIDRTSKAEVKAVLDFLSAIPPDQQRKVKVQEQAPEAADRHREEQLDGEEREGEGREGGEREGERGGEEGGESDGAANQDLNA